jgi:CBS domain containing-hemolysin-like protein
MKDFLRFSRIPIYQEKVDHINGFIMKYDILDNMANDKHDVKLKDLKREMLTVYERISVSDFFEMLIENREHIALVIDEYGGVSGVATMEDVLETLLGLEIVDEFDQNIDMQQFARDKWKERAKRLGIIQDTNDNFELPNNKV